MTLCEGFRTFKERGEWVELQFMARAVRKGFKVSKPWGDSSAYDVGIESGERILRVQVKSTDAGRSTDICASSSRTRTANLTR
jgi:PD-(D/E)XK nuclease superfamily protein